MQKFTIRIDKYKSLFEVWERSEADAVKTLSYKLGIPPEKMQAWPAVPQSRQERRRRDAPRS